MESTDDIEMLLPGLKVSSSLIRQQPLRRGEPHEEQQQQKQGASEEDPRVGSRAKAAKGQKGAGSKAMKAGSKRRRPTEMWALDLELCSGEAKRFQAGGEASGSSARVLLPPLQTDGEDSGALELLQAGITTTMRDELIESPRTAPHQPLDAPAKPSSRSPSPSPTAYPTAAPSGPASAAAASAQEDLSASPAHCDRIPGNGKCGEMAAEGKPPVGPSAEALASCTRHDVMLSSCGLEPYLSGIQEDMSPCRQDSPVDHSARGSSPDEGDALPEEYYVKSKSAPPRMKPQLPSRAPRGCTGGSASEGEASSEKGPSVEKRVSLSSSPSPPRGSPPAYQKCSLSRTEKWHERISIAALRLKSTSRSLPCTPHRPRNGLAAQ